MCIRDRYKLLFQGTPDDARTLLIGTAGTMISVVALVLGLTVVALQVASGQYSPRLLGNFLRDRQTQIVLSVFVATFAYCTAGLYTVGISGGSRVEEFPRLAVTSAILLVFACLGFLILLHRPPGPLHSARHDYGRRTTKHVPRDR